MQKDFFQWSSLLNFFKMTTQSIKAKLQIVVVKNNCVDFSLFQSNENIGAMDIAQRLEHQALPSIGYRFRI